METNEQIRVIKAAAGSGRFEDIPNPLSVPEAAAIARRSRATITRACRAGMIKAVNTGTKWCINRDSLLRYAALL